MLTIVGDLAVIAISVALSAIFLYVLTRLWDPAFAVSTMT